MFIARSLNCKVRNDLLINLLDENTLIIEIHKTEFDTTANILVVVCYRAPHVAIFDFLNKLEKLLEKLQREKSYIYFTGDLNVNTLNISPTQDTIANTYNNLLLSYSYKPLVDKPTRVTEHSSTLIDHMYTNMCYAMCKTAILKAKLADHYGFTCVRNLKTNRK